MTRIKTRTKGTRVGRGDKRGEPAFSPIANVCFRFSCNAVRTANAARLTRIVRC